MLCLQRDAAAETGFVKQCCGWGDRSWPIRARLGDLLCRSAQDRKERESCLNGVTIEQGYCRSHLGRMANMAVGHALQQTLSYLHVGYCKTHITLTLPEISHCSCTSNLTVLTRHPHIYNSDNGRNNCKSIYALSFCVGNKNEKCTNGGNNLLLILSI